MVKASYEFDILKTNNIESPKAEYRRTQLLSLMELY